MVINQHLDIIFEGENLKSFSLTSLQVPTPCVSARPVGTEVPPYALLEPERGDAMSPTLTALLCLGTLPKPSIWADPGPMVTKGSPVTIWCQASLRADVYYLYKERVYESLSMKTSEDSSDRVSFSFASMSSHSSGRYQCAYQRGKNWSQRSDLLALVVTASSFSKSVCDPLELLVSGTADTVSPPQNNSDPSSASDRRDYTVENLIRMGVAALILVVLGILLLEAQHSQARTPGAARS
ncbi:leukocyte immunoglobulin-like receptor subfamily A member 5 [Leptonychotes weddellii]|uniref:Leukocyte immunoglobulin-like receptor subfamily A member 5 n=1 Tax=Leptonychotes weddellii TaxID=9713 RepID=A0A7F8RKW5_LEPWE|nr:leukocyte immunoglobulin-like receptor subfamily A member 5 [Leptonychotes weddellii]